MLKGRRLGWQLPEGPPPGGQYPWLLTCSPDAPKSALSRACRDDGVGLAAPQIGVNVRLMVFNEAGEKGKGEEVSPGPTRMQRTQQGTPL